MNEMKLLAGHPIYVDRIPIYSPKLSNIALIDEDVYNSYLCICLSMGVNKSLNFPQVYEDIFDNISLSYPDEVLEMFYLALEFFTGEIFTKQKHLEQIYFASEKSVLYKDNYNQFYNILKLVNGMEDEKPTTIKRNTELDKKIEEAKKRINQKLNKSTDDNSNIQLKDLISVLASKHNNLNIINVWDLNIYQFNDQFKRMQLIDNYDIGIRSLLAGADKKNIQLEHYIKKI